MQYVSIAQCTIGGHETLSAEASLTQFITEEFLLHPMKASPSSSSSSSSGAGKGGAPSPRELDEIDVLEGGIRAWAACAGVVEAAGSSGSSGSEVGAFASQEAARGVGDSTTRVMQALFGCLQKHGSQLGQCRVGQARLRDRLREACARALMDVIKVDIDSSFYFYLTFYLTFVIVSCVCWKFG
jgi:hypothetical protein